MEKNNIYQDISARTGGEIYLGVVGPVRSGKSTFIKRFLELMVLRRSPTSMKGSGRWMRCRRAAPERRS